MKRHDKKTRKEKQKLFQKEKSGSPGKSKICKVTKGEHVYNTTKKTWYGHELVCACGKKNYRIPYLKPLNKLPKYMICKKHGFFQIYKSDVAECWACKLGLKAFKE